MGLFEKVAHVSGPFLWMCPLMLRNKKGQSGYRIAWNWCRRYPVLQIMTCKSWFAQCVAARSVTGVRKWWHFDGLVIRKLEVNFFSLQLWREALKHTSLPSIASETRLFRADASRIIFIIKIIFFKTKMTTPNTIFLKEAAPVPQTQHVVRVSHPIRQDTTSDMQYNRVSKYIVDRTSTCEMKR